MIKTITYIITIWFFYSCAAKAPGEENYITIKKTSDFSVTGEGKNSKWNETSWIEIPRRTNDSIEYTTRAKILYSPSGLYFLFSCTDSILTNTMLEDRGPLYNEDVLEVFLMPDETIPAYFEYELSPLNFETPLLIFNSNGDLNSWHPFEIAEKRKIRHQTTILQGEKKSNASVNGWIAEFFIPFDLLTPVMKKYPGSGTRWKANLYRIDYDQGEALWSWKLNSGNFHEYEKFGTIQFE